MVINHLSFFFEVKCTRNCWIICVILQKYNKKQVTVGIRTENIGLKGHTSIPDTGNIVKATVDVVEPLGAETHVFATVEGDQSIVARVDPHISLRPGDQMELLVKADSIHAFDVESEENIRYNWVGIHGESHRFGFNALCGC